jgi:hypothetical protein
MYTKALYDDAVTVKEISHLLDGHHHVVPPKDRHDVQSGLALAGGGLTMGRNA